MKRKTNIIFVILIMIMFCFVPSVFASENIFFSDSILKEQVLYYGMTADYNIGDQNSDGEISIEEAEQITILDLYSKCSLEDLKYFPNLTRLSFSLTDFESLDELNNIELNNLKIVWLYNNPKLEDISALEKFDTIKEISLSEIPVKDITFLGNLSNLEQVFLNYLDISDVSTLNNNKNLKYISFMGLPNVKDISGLTDLTNLLSFRMFSTGITDISPLANSTKIETIAAPYLKMTNLDFLKNYTNLSYLEMTYGTLEDISGLSNCTALEVAILHDNNISDIDVFANCPKLFTLNISTNPVSDIEVLVSLNSQSHVFIDTNVNPYDDATFHVICTIKERDGNFLLGDCSKFEVVKEESIHISIETEKVEVDGESISVIPIDSKTKIEDILNISNFPTIEDYEIKVVDKDGNEKDSSKKLGSRDIIQIKDEEGNVVEEHIVIVNGDVNGDGEIKIYDSFQILKGSIKLNTTMDAIESKIRDFNNDGKVVLYDAFQFLKKSIIG